MESNVTDFSVKNLTVGVNNSTNTIILRNINFELAAGKILGVIGEAGSGKTVLAKSLLKGLVEPLEYKSGQVLFGNEDIVSISGRKLAKIRGNKVAYIGSNPVGALDPTVSIGSQIVEKLRTANSGVLRNDAYKEVIKFFTAVKIPSPELRFHEFPFQFSGGMMQRVMIVDALITNPSILIADNITQALDVTVAAQIIKLLLELRRNNNTAILFISSSLPIVETIADEIMVLHNGEIVELATPKNLISNPKHHYTKSLLKRVPKIWEDNVSCPVAVFEAPIMAISNVTKTYKVRKKGSFRGVNEVKAVRGITLNIRKGENIGIIGESGCGKSTFTRLLAWLEKPEQGSITFDGIDLSSLTKPELKKLRQSFQLLLQDPYSSLPSRQSVGRIISEPLLIHFDYSKQEVRERVLSAMAEVGLDPALENQLTVGLSAGQRQRINIARALVLEPKLMILDETLSSLDQVEQSKLLELFDALQQKHGFTYIFISHDMALVRKVCHRIAVMYLGQMVEVADNDSLFNAPLHPYSKALLSSIPTLDRNPFDSKGYLLDGEPPSPVNIAKGCSFRTRCPFAIDECSIVEPDLNRLSNQNQVACHLVDVNSTISANLAKIRIDGVQDA